MVAKQCWSCRSDGLTQQCSGIKVQAEHECGYICGVASTALVQQERPCVLFYISKGSQKKTLEEYCSEYPDLTFKMVKKSGMGEKDILSCQLITWESLER